jgi:hypothetical protein
VRLSVTPPTFLAESLWSVDLDTLLEMGIKGVILDLDNTLVDWNESWLRPQVLQWIAAAKERGIRLCLVSNALRGERVKQVAGNLGIGAVLRAGKPLPGAFRKGMEALGTDPRSTCVIGDQVFTDIVGANRLGLVTVLVPPLSPREASHTRLIRLIERPLRGKWARTRPTFGGSTAEAGGERPVK